MGVETDLVLADRSQARAVLASHDPAKEFGGVYAKGTDPISLGALLTALTGEDYDDAIIDEFPEIISDESGEKTVCGVPARFRQALSALSEEEIPDIVERWMETEEFFLTGWDDSIAEAFLRDMMTLLSSEGADRKELWIAISV